MQEGREGPRGDGEKYAAVFDNKNRGASEAPWPQTLALRRAGNWRVGGQLLGSHGTCEPVLCIPGQRWGVGQGRAAPGCRTLLGTSTESAAGRRAGTRAVTGCGTGFPLGPLASRLCRCPVPMERCRRLEAQCDAEVLSWSRAPCTEPQPGELLSWEAAADDCREGLAEPVRGIALVVPHCPQTRRVPWGASLASAGMDTLQEPCRSPLPGSGRTSSGFRMLPPISSRVSLQSLHRAITKCDPASPFAPFPQVSNALGAGPEQPCAAKSSCQLGSANPHFSAEPGAARPAAIPCGLCCRGRPLPRPRGGSAGSWADGELPRRAVHCGAGEDLFLLLVRVRSSENCSALQGGSDPSRTVRQQLGVQPRWRA